MFKKVIHTVCSLIFGFGGVLSVVMSAGCSGSEGDSQFVVDSLVFERNCVLSNILEKDPLGGRSCFRAAVDYPVHIDTVSFSALTDSVKLWISMQLMPGSDKPILSKSVIDHAANNFIVATNDMIWGEELVVAVKKVYEDNVFVSYEYDRYYFCGNRNNSYNSYGATFDKKSGRRVTWDNFVRDDKLRKKITSEIRKVKDNLTDEQLMGLLVIKKQDCILNDNTLALPLPNASPWKTSLGWVFTYQPAEIFPVRQGAPACCLADVATKE